MPKVSKKEKARRALLGMVRRDKAAGRTPVVTMDRLASAPSLSGIPRSSLRRIITELAREGRVVRLAHGRFSKMPELEAHAEEEGAKAPPARVGGQRPEHSTALPIVLRLIQEVGGKGYLWIKFERALANRITDEVLSQLRDRGFIADETKKGGAWIIRPDLRRL